jgi:diphthamide biosynthesis protein 3
MASVYEEVELQDMDWDAKKQEYTYPCPCGDKFLIGLDELWDGEDIAPCPSCTLRIRVVYEETDLPEYEERSDDDEEEGKAEERKEESKEDKQPDPTESDDEEAYVSDKQ